MARIRTIKPEFFSSAHVGQVSVPARLLFIGLWTHADRAGRLNDRENEIKAKLFPYNSEINIGKLLDELVRAQDETGAGLIQRYTTKDGRKLIQITKLVNHQHFHVREPESTLPAPDEHGARTRQARGRPRTSTYLAPPEGKGRERKEEESICIGEVEVGGRGEKEEPPTQKRARQLPVNFNLTDPRRQYAASQGVRDPDQAFEQFHDHHTAKGSRMLDWDAAWRTWCRNAVTRFAPRGNHRQPDAPPEDRQAHEAAIRRDLGIPPPPIPRREEEAF